MKISSLSSPLSLPFPFPYLCFLFFGFILTYIILKLILLGIFGKLLKNSLLDKINKKDFVWFNKFYCLCFLIILIIKIFSLSINTVFLDTSINIKLNDIHFSIKGDYLDTIFSNFGTASVFIVGSKIAASFVLKSKMSLGAKIGTVVGSGSLTTATFHTINNLNGIIKGKIIPRQIENSSISLEIKDVVISDGTSNSFFSYLNSKPAFLFPKFKPDSKFILNDERLGFLYPSLTESFKVTQNKDLNTRVIELLKERAEKENFEKLLKEFDDFIITSPLEPNELAFSQIKNDLFTVLSGKLIIDIITVYLIIILIYIFTVKFLINKNTNLEKIKNWFFGNYIHYILSKIILGWEKSSIIWIYFILFSLLISSIGSIYILFGCLIILKN